MLSGVFQRASSTDEDVTRWLQPPKTSSSASDIVRRTAPARYILTRVPLRAAAKLIIGSAAELIACVTQRDVDSAVRIRGDEHQVNTTAFGRHRLYLERTIKEGLQPP